MNDAARRVLVLDDDPGVLSVLAARFRKLPIHLVQCTELEAAETLLDHLEFGVVIVDLEVSELGGLEGIRLIRHAVTNFGQTEVIVFSGNVTPFSYKLATALGVTEILEKPGDLDRLVNLVALITTDPFSAAATGRKYELTAIEPLEKVVGGKRVSTVFQPIIRLGGTGQEDRLFGLEALSRGPQESLLSNPMILFDYAVRKELVFQTDTLCIDCALGSAAELSPDTFLFINTHPRALSHPGYPATLEHLLKTHRLNRDRVVLEVTEQSAILDSKGLAAILEAVRSQGVRIALDDFGEGSSNLDLIHDLQPEFLKIAGRFCQDIERRPMNQALVKSAVTLSRDLGIQTVMERVETNGELQIVRDLGIDYVQGYHLGRPQTISDLAADWPEAVSPSEPAAGRAAAGRGATGPREV